MANGGRLFIFARVDNKTLKEWVLIEFLIIFFTGDEVYVWLNFSDCVNLIVDFVYAFFDPHFFELSAGVVPEVKVLKLKIESLLWFIAFEPKFGVTVAWIRQIIFFELMFPFGNRFGIILPQIHNAVVYHNLTHALGADPADQFALFEVFYVPPSDSLSHHCGAPLFVGSQINQP